MLTQNKRLATIESDPKALALFQDTFDLVFFNTEDRARYFFAIESLGSNVKLPDYGQTQDPAIFCQDI